MEYNTLEGHAAIKTNKDEEDWMGISATSKGYWKPKRLIFTSKNTTGWWFEPL